ncbi:MAG: serine/threonine protein kinase [Thermoguttaceae bacterium]
MSTDPTQPQGGQQRRQSREMSLDRAHPPTQVPGYRPEKFLGAGAYGEVWVAVEQNTGRRVAIKFYAHRGGLDWSLLSREVEKLAFLFADRYVVQLLGVGWDAEPPYYIMEYLDHGSLAERLEQGVMPVDEAVELFREVAVGLVHAHGKGVLHCDLKPANILLDQDNKPRLADFGQSRLSSEQAPALGTLFYMAPEQADIEASPDARWDVYALGALLYCMLTGGPPHRDERSAGQFEQTPDLQQRLAVYRELVEQSATALVHRQVRGVDRALAEIIDRCLAADPDQRFPNVQAVLDALEARRLRRQRRPMMILGAAGPALLLLVGLFFAWQGFNSVIGKSDAALTARALDGNQYAARLVAQVAGYELERRWSAVERLAESERFRQALADTLNRPQTSELLEKLSDPSLSKEEAERLRRQFHDDPRRLQLEEEFEALFPPGMKPPEGVASWFFCDARGVAVLRIPRSTTIGKDFAWRSFYYGGPVDRQESWRPGPDEHVSETTLSAVFRSQASHRWIVAISTPVYDDSPQRKFLGVVALTIEVGRLIELEGGDGQFAVLVDWREGDNKGVILQHPLFDKLFEQQGKLPDRFKNYRLAEADLPDNRRRQEHYTDPLQADPEGEQYRKHWLAQMEAVRVAGRDTGWVVIVQETYEGAIGSTLEKLKAGLVRYGLIALAMVALVMASLWTLAARSGGGR